MSRRKKKTKSKKTNKKKHQKQVKSFKSFSHFLLNWTNYQYLKDRLHSLWHVVSILSPFLPAEVPLSKHLTSSPAGDPDLWPPPAERTGTDRRQDSPEHHIIMITVICSVTLVMVIACADCFLSITCEAGGGGAAAAAGAGGAAASPVRKPSAT